MALFTISNLMAAAILAAVQALAAPQASTVPSGAASINACAQLSSSALAQATLSPKATPTFAPSVVHQCLEDVPVNITQAVTYVDYIEAFLQFQTTLTYLKHPPAAYRMPAVDLLGGIATIKRDILSGIYTSDMSLQYDIFKLFSVAADGHLSISPFSLRSFTFSRADPLVSISSDGVSLPKLYLLSDVTLAAIRPNSTLSEVIQIGASNTTDALLQAPQYPWFQDYDAAYNYKLHNPATKYLSSSDAFDTWTSGGAFHAHDVTNYTFANGTTLSRPDAMKANSAIRLDFDSGAEFYSKYLAPAQRTAPSSASATSSAPGASSSASRPTTSSTAASATASKPSAPKLTGYPQAVIEHSEDLIAGYFLAGHDTSDVAVLNIPSFNAAPSSPAALPEFQAVLSSFLKQCRAKKRLIIDVRGNGGGSPYLAYDAFKQLFPNLGTPYSGIRFRAQPYTDVMGIEISKVGIAETPFSAGYSLQSPDGKPFSNWSALYGPHQVNGDNFSSIASWSFANESLDLQTAGIVVSGYANNSNIPPSPFDASNVTIFTDGACTSTCGLFVNLLINQAKVKSVVVGGRPSYAPMALIGGSQGGEDLAQADIQSDAQVAIAAARYYSGANSTNFKETKAALSILADPAPLSLLTWGINFRDNIAQGDASQTPLQFTYRAADCRFFYVAADIFAVNNTWTRIAKGIAANGEGLCINGTVASWTGDKYGGYESGTTVNAYVSALAAIAAAAVTVFYLVSGLGH